MRNHHPVFGNAGFLIGLLSFLTPWIAIGEDAFPAKDLVEIAVRHQMPMPPKNARLVLAHTGSWAVLGNESTSRDPSIYAPAFLLRTMADGSIVILRGTEEEVLVKKQLSESLWRPFSVVQPQPKLGGYVSDFNRLSVLVCAVQLAARGDKTNAQRIWQRVSASRGFVDGEPHENVAEELKNPRLLLARCMYGHLKNRVLDQPENWSTTSIRLRALFNDFTALGEDPYRKAVLDGLSAALIAPHPKPDSTEALLIAWSRIPRNLQCSDVADQNASQKLYQKLVLRGADAVPDLVPLLNDRRVTTHEAGGIMNVPSRVCLLGDLAEQVLKEITGIPYQPSGEGAGPGRYLAWLEKSRQTGEDKILIESLFKREQGKITEVNEASARILAEKYPYKLPALCEEFCVSAKPGTQANALADAITEAQLPKAIKIEKLIELVDHGSLEHKRAVLPYLARLDSAKCQELLLAIIRTLPSDAATPYWTCPEAGFTHTVMLLEDDAIWREYLQAARRSSVGLRMEMMEPMTYAYIGQTNRSRRLAFLAAFINDEGLREMPDDREGSKFTGPCAAFTFKRISVQDFAARQIASILQLPDHPDEFWPPSKWKTLRAKVRTKLKNEKLPKF